MDLSGFEGERPADYLTRLAASTHGQAYKKVAAAAMGIRAGDVVLELGCGPGADLGRFAAAVGDDGRVIGVDSDPHAAREAADSCARMPQVDVCVGDIHALGLRDASVDRAHTDRVLQHVADPAAVLAETRRVLRGEGTAVFCEPDWDTLVIDYPGLLTARAYTRYITEQVIRNPAIGRQLARLATGAGFRVEKVMPLTAVFRDVQAADKVFGFRRVTERAVGAGYLTQQAAGQWLGYLATEPFFAAATLFVVTAVAA